MTLDRSPATSWVGQHNDDETPTEMESSRQFELGTIGSDAPRHAEDVRRRVHAQQTKLLDSAFMLLPEPAVDIVPLLVWLLEKINTETMRRGGMCRVLSVNRLGSTEVTAVSRRSKPDAGAFVRYLDPLVDDGRASTTSSEHA